ncbi:conserved Plasmodium protein, unknown function [Plasmodium gallinaceum]|uniref:RanBP2-type domain-containing protein n=1 Tax=Plasmodium gallinaceum TaxID=5849 RepID=A0A1J1GYD6_PLAGA|nr:conserved Plasmodium protein, unknown function [Plasmodium gallinaceum]CRG97564.1 conserved Plasmodium protein, unknown function [Plasmodium gallinaceum]
MSNAWRCEACLVMNSEDAYECVCCMQKRNINIEDNANTATVTSSTIDSNNNDNINNSEKKKNNNNNKKLTNNEKAKSSEESITKNKNTKVKKNATNILKDTKKKEKNNVNENVSKLEGGGFMPSVKPADNHESSKSIFLTGIDNTSTPIVTTTSNKQKKELKNNLEEKNKVMEKNKVIEKNKEKKKIESNEKGSNKRIQPARKCTQKKICYKT